MANKLEQAASLYLKQHADNPVEWYPWGEEALAHAKRDNKPILLSIGYSACHWCHVMARESFSNPDIANIMNQYFINIKVDREERPDLDKIYQTAHQLLTKRSGGWPLTVFLTPEDLCPFFAGTYFPPATRFGLPGFPDLLQKVAEFYQEHKHELLKQNQQLCQILKNINHIKPSDKQFSDLPINTAQHELAIRFDTQNGGFDQAPKFPQPVLLNHLLETQKEDAQRHFLFSLMQMAQKGIYDHIGGGFFRYAVDGHWEIPHFEKMLYDNAQLLEIYSYAASIDNNPIFAKVIKKTIEWLTNEMHDVEGGFYSSLNADSEHQEGKYYVWSKEEIKKLLSQKEFNMLNQISNLHRPANFEGYWHLYYQDSLEHEKILDRAIVKLFKKRWERIHPSRDNKILTSWNALLIKGLCAAYQHLDQLHYYKLATENFNFLKENLWKDRQLFSCYSEHETYQPAFLDDYAFLLDATLSLLQQRWDNDNLQFAIDIAEAILDKFYDSEHGGFYFTQVQQTDLFYRPKHWQDDVMPSGIGVATTCLQRLGYLLDNSRYSSAAENTLKAAWQYLERYPLEHLSLIKALKEYLNPTKIVIIRGNNTELTQWHTAIKKTYYPHQMVFAIKSNENNLPEAIAIRKSDPNKTLAYICTGTQCSLPITDLDNLMLPTSKTVFL